MIDLDAAYQREQLLLEVLLDIRDALSASPKPKPPSEATTNPLAALDTFVGSRSCVRRSPCVVCRSPVK